MKDQFLRPNIFAFVLANLIVLTVFAYCFWINYSNLDFYFLFIDEDGYVEWATTWAFLLASIASLFGAIRGQVQIKKFHWFYIGLSLFCFVVAMEEISWGQRLFGFQSPKYFLENNYQQEFTAHNMISDSLRNFTFYFIVIGYGIILPLCMLVPKLRRLIVWLGVVAPPIELIPSFYAIVFIYKTKPLVGIGEVVELMLGLSFLFAIVFSLWDFTPLRIRSRVIEQLILIIGISFLTFGLGFVTSELTLNKDVDNSKLIDDSLKEMEAIKNDFKQRSKQLGRFPIKEHSNMRLFISVNNNDFEWMYKGEFSALKKEGLSNNRANYFLDPWNMAYWVGFRVDNDTNKNRLVFYSFGPNRKPDSFKGDDIRINLFETDLE